MPFLITWLGILCANHTQNTFSESPMHTIGGDYLTYQIGLITLIG